MITNESKYYLLLNVIPYSGIDLDFHIVKSGSLEEIAKAYSLRERNAKKYFVETFKSIERDLNDAWSFSFDDDKGNTLKYLMCGKDKVRDFVTHI